MADVDERPAKRQRIEPTVNSSEQGTANKNGSSQQSPSNGGSGKKSGYKNTTPNQPKRFPESSKLVRTFTQPSAISSGDKGIFVSSDKGREKKCLLELHDTVQEYLEQKGLDSLGQPVNHLQDSSTAQGIEDDIAAELSSMRDKDLGSSSKMKAKPLQLITLDVPCVSFLRFPPGSALDPVEVVHNLCLSAMDNTTPQRSRYVKRLTPILSLGKTLSQGLQRASDEVLPGVFGADAAGKVHPFTFAIRPTIRNNDKMDRDEVIKSVASRVQELGQNMHSVDLKQYEKGILVEVYRGWIGMSVVDNIDASNAKLGFEELKRFNLAEIYASR